MWRSPKAEEIFLTNSFDFARFGRAQPPWPPAPMSASGIRRKRLVRKELMNCIALASFTHTRTAVLALSALGPKTAILRKCRKIAPSPPGSKSADCRLFLSKLAMVPGEHFHETYST
jgi:hypothetical protein